MERRIFFFDEDSLQSSSSDTSSITPSQSTTTINDYSLQSSGTQGSSDGIFEDHPGLNPSSERIVEIQSDIHDKLGELMINRGPEDVLAAAEALHAESDNIPFLEYLLNDLNISGVQGEAYTDALDLAGLVPSPLEQFAILPLIPMKIGNLYFSFTNSSLFMLLTLSLVLLLVHFVTKKGGGNLVPNACQSLVELIYDFVLNLVNEQIGGLSGNVKQKFFPCILVTFTFLLFCNLQGDPGPLFIVLALTGLELGVAILQAHVSTISICIYLNDATNLHQSGYFFIIEQKRGAKPLYRVYEGPDRKKKKRFFRLRTKCCFQAGSLSNRSQRAYRFRIPPRSNKADPCTTHQIKLGEVESKQERQPKRKQEERADEARPAQVHKRIPRDETEDLLRP
ncbi:ATP synthase subunit, putative [Ricinus communis]|uniref:F-ATPase protein 6 n=1 Tax=Ricinus communis TaxID=3988 RepID=B9T8M9_RICCO|nr:ATP synthase subunit, putative [Ricinus communis]